MTNQTPCIPATTTTTTTTTTAAPLPANIQITNGSLDVEISQVNFNSVTATYVAGQPLPNTTGNGTDLNTTQVGTYTLDVYRNNGVAGQHITVTDSNGTQQCIYFSNGSAVESYFGVVYDGVTNIQIDVQDGTCPIPITTSTTTTSTTTTPTPTTSTTTTTTTILPVGLLYSSTSAFDACNSGLTMTGVVFIGGTGLCDSISIQCNEFLLEAAAITIWISFGGQVREAVIDDPNVSGIATFVTGCTFC